MENSKEFWAEYWDKEKREIFTSNSFIFEDIIEKNIPELMNGQKDKSYFEVGCAPGNVMVFFNKKYGCTISGCDFVSCIAVADNIKKSGIKTFHLYESDFRNLDLKNKYDLVASYGFVEHFDNYSTIIKRHKKLVADNGYLIIEIPNIRKCNYLFYKIFLPNILKNHNTKIMDLKVLRKEIEDENFEILFNNYYLTNMFMANSNNEFVNRNKIIKYIFMSSRKILEKLHCSNIPNKYLSPYIICIARKKR